MLRHHQPTKDKYLFPAIEELLGNVGAMSSDTAEHEQFMQSFKVFEMYAERTKPAEYKAEEMATKNAVLRTHACWVFGCQDKSFKLDGKEYDFPNILPWCNGEKVIATSVVSLHG
ncbi:hypothetical protein DV736_g3114, partial [Chaetothyriales sp. CBS 134916]